jgi:HK97 family phage prohead protease
VRESRSLKADLARLEVRADGEAQTITGYAAVFERYSQNLGGFVEVVDRRAFDRTLRSADVVALHNHDPNRALGRVSAGSLRLSVDDVGLRYEVDIRTSTGRQVAEDVAAGILTASSFSFRTMPDGDEWGRTEQGYPLRTLTEVELFDVSPVVYPAYRATEGKVALRSLAESRGLPLDLVEQAAAKNELRQLLEEPTAEESGKPPVAATAPLASYRHRLRVVELEAPRRTA